jgi:hypothetical protein
VIRGLRVHLTGSAVEGCDGALLATAHSFVHSLVEEVVANRGGLVVGAGGEPRGDSGQPCIFDWTALDVVAEAPDPAPEWPVLRPERFVAVASQRGLEKVPDDRAEIWKRCRNRSDFELDVAPPGWRMAGIIRQRQVLRGDILVALGGGAGAEHLAELYRDDGKPVIPIYAELGALNNDGNGGSRFLHERALADPDAFFRLRDGAGSAAGRLSSLRLRVDADAVALTKEVVQVLADLRPPSAFYVRLLATDHPDYPGVECFFRDVVDAVAAERGFTPREMGRGHPEWAFMNVEIFEALHRAGVVVVDLTGVRPNCMMELGYALARRRRVVISAKKGTTLPFDEDKLPTYLWEDAGARDDRIHSYRDWFDRYSELPPIVE